jgi:hypothetical protein
VNQIVFNSFPRSGNVYSGHCYPAFINGMYATVHIPEIFSVEEIDNITIFRKPEDAISSLINKQFEYAPPGTNIHISGMTSAIDENIKLYRQYMEYAAKYKDIVYIGKFDDLINNTVSHFENVSKWFERPLIAGYKERFENISFNGKLWEDRHDGHVPRPKDETRLKIESEVAKLNNIQKLNKDYEDFIAEYATKVD